MECGVSVSVAVEDEALPWLFEGPGLDVEGEPAWMLKPGIGVEDEEVDG